MGKNKKRKRSQNLLHAAEMAAAKRAAAKKESLRNSFTALVSEEGSDNGGEGGVKEKGKGAFSSPTNRTNNNNNNNNNIENSDDDDDDDDEATILSSQNLAITIQTLQYLSKNPERIHEKDMKPLRTALHPLVVEQCKTYDKGVDYKQKVTHHLSKHQWSQALSTLQACRDFGQIPKQGTIQRWVRDVDCESCQGTVKIQLLTAILNINNNNNNQQIDDTINKNDKSNINETQNETDPKDTTNDDNDKDNVNDGLNKHDPRVALLKLQQQQQQQQQQNESNNNENNKNEDTSSNGMEGLEILDHWEIPSDSIDKKQETDKDTTKEVSIAAAKIIYEEKAAERTPPNHYDLHLHGTFAPGTIQFDPNKTNENNNDNNLVGVNVHKVPFVQGGFVLSNVLTNDECDQLVAAATKLTYRPDHPTHLDKPTGIDSCEWLIDSSIHDPIFERVQSHLPKFMGGSSSSSSSSNYFQLHSINRRWRFFRYGQDCVYRPHIDGSWPESRYNTKTKQYETDKSGATKSFLTFLIYLNEGFEGGQTRFYYPKQTNDNDNDTAATTTTTTSSSPSKSSLSTSMQARGITPKKGCVMVFPQGNTASLLHEGSAVTKGTKLVVRTDVLYSKKQSSSTKKQT